LKRSDMAQSSSRFRHTAPATYVLDEALPVSEGLVSQLLDMAQSKDSPLLLIPACSPSDLSYGFREWGRGSSKIPDRQLSGIGLTSTCGTTKTRSGSGDGAS
jgi:hypothetical protein